MYFFLFFKLNNDIDQKNIKYNGLTNWNCYKKLNRIHNHFLNENCLVGNVYAWGVLFFRILHVNKSTAFYDQKVEYIWNDERWL